MDFKIPIERIKKEIRKEKIKIENNLFVMLLKKIKIKIYTYVSRIISRIKYNLEK